jgi:hypothetical protein
LAGARFSQQISLALERIGTWSVGLVFYLEECVSDNVYARINTSLPIFTFSKGMRMEH